MSVSLPFEILMAALSRSSWPPFGGPHGSHGGLGGGPHGMARCPEGRWPATLSFALATPSHCSSQREDDSRLCVPHLSPPAAASRRQLESQSNIHSAFCRLSRPEEQIDKDRFMESTRVGDRQIRLHLWSRRCSCTTRRLQRTSV